jgi:hypothetical protein
MKKIDVRKHKERNCERKFTAQRETRKKNDKDRAGKGKEETEKNETR